ncbi:hypothetical protein H7A76_23710 [Pseudomonas sp. MSSRFD41]|uniref:hypothetical protein n=1 Tax=Pseudomonas sp. MSSRFD41 TaxID=1310370 RepID=UPI00163A4E57|nr:hypothetical protein [Pseudomonas sp. MSSRFD41]MBC2658457.1 hypothetical protein [Pseudomonas sp. MSSRFD41]
MQATNSTMTHADFESVIGNIASFFKDDKYGMSHRSVNYRATSEEIDELCEKLDLVSVDNESTTEEEVKAVKKLKDDCKNDLTVDIKHFNEGINKHTKSFESSKNQDDFKKRVHEIAESARVATNNMISHWEKKY